jgi:RHS repeat-associated protein
MACSTCFFLLLELSNLSPFSLNPGVDSFEGALQVFEWRMWLPSSHGCSSCGETLRHVHGLAVDRPLATVDASGVAKYYLADHLGSVVQETSSAEQVISNRQYDPYGALLVGDGASGYAFTGREWDSEVSLYFFRARYYDPHQARFLSTDPLGLRFDNLYTYVSNAPLRWIDPFGLEQKPPTWPDGTPQVPTNVPGYDPNTWKYTPPSGPGRRGKFEGPANEKGSRPQITWDEEDKYWSKDDGRGGKRQHFADDGTEIDPRTKTRPSADEKPRTPPGGWWQSLMDLFNRGNDFLLPAPVCLAIPELCKDPMFPKPCGGD